MGFRRAGALGGSRLAFEQAEVRDSTNPRAFAQRIRRRLTLWVVLCCAFVSLFSGAMVLLIQSYSSGDGTGATALWVARDVRGSHSSLSLSLIFLLGTASGCAVVSWACSWLCERIVKPLQQLRSHSIQVANGLTFENVRFDTEDFFPELADAYNQQMARYREVMFSGERRSDRPDGRSPTSTQFRERLIRDRFRKPNSIQKDEKKKNVA